MTRTFTTIDNESRFNQIKNYFNDNLDIELEEFIDGTHHQLTVSCDTFSPKGKQAAKLISQVEHLFSTYTDVEVM